MGRSPALVIIARHGARLDAADPQWHLTSPTPYDPPLTYGGWRQSQMLGARIASIIRNREVTPGDLQGRGESSDRHSHHLRARRRKHKVVIHTSPFLRCVQTSVAVSAGMDQYVGNKEAVPEKPHAMHSGSPLLRARENAAARNLASIPEPEESSARRSRTISPKPQDDLRTLLRIDAFLGEWLSPDYYEDITPPPGSKMMVASAKADLLRRGDPIDALNISITASSKQGHFPGGWRGRGSDPEETSELVEEGSLSSLSALQEHLPKVTRANTFSSSRGPGFRNRRTVRVGNQEQTARYVPPTPSYAVSPSQAIPQGYVAHARDACVNVDYQWDSLRPPLDWGSGGDYGEEWSSMHRRFRGGLHKMLQWYRNNGTLQRPDDGTSMLPSLTKTDTNPSEELDDDIDTILIIITHGAGCNALIGALTNQPVLIDVGMASLTLAERKNVDYKRLEFRDGSSHSPTRQRRSFMDSGDSEEYDVKIVASTDHLRPGSQFSPEALRDHSPILPNRERSPYRYERHHQHPSSGSPLQENFGVGPDGLTPKNHAEALRRSTTTSESSVGGLWTPPKLKPVDERHNEATGVDRRQGNLLNTFLLPGEVKVNAVHTSDSPVTFRDIAGSPPETPTGPSLTQTGLWGAPPHALATERDKGAKRRWTLSQAA